MMENKAQWNRYSIVNEPKLKKVCEEESISYFALFGSYASGNETAESDIDLLVRVNGKQNLLKILGIKKRFESILGTKVDLLTEKSISRHIFPQIQDHLVVIYENSCTRQSFPVGE